MIKPRINFLLYALLACFWSFSFVGIKAVVGVWPPLFGAVARVGIALICLILLAIFLRRNIKLPFSLQWKIWIMGMFSQGAPMAFLFWGEHFISPGLAGILNGTVPIWAFILSLIFLRKTTEFTFSKTLGLILGITGVCIIFWPMLTFEKNIGTLIGAMSVLAMAVSYAVGALLNQYLLTGVTRIDFFTNIYHQHWGSFAFLVIVASVFNSWPAMNQLTAGYLPWAASLYLGIFSTAIAYFIYYHLIRVWDAVRGSSVMYVVPALALIWDALIYTNIPTDTEVAGIIIILVGVILIQLSNFKKVFLAKLAVAEADK